MSSTATASPAREVLSSRWDGLSQHLLASIFVVNNDGTRQRDGFEISCPLTNASMEVVANWQSPFESMGPESRAPTLTAMLQSGTLANTLSALIGGGADEVTDTGAFRTRLSKEITEVGSELQGRTGMTKLNSTQVFGGAPPVKIHATAHFRAFKDAAVEVHAPLEALIRWSLPAKLATFGGIAGALQSFKNGQGVLKSILPSEAPPMVGLIYGGWGFSPMVIECVGVPLTGPRSKHGEMVQVSVDITLATLTALDAQDWKNTIQLSGPIRSSGRS